MKIECRSNAPRVRKFERGKPFFTRWYANSKDVIVCGHKNSDVDNNHCPSCFGKYSHDRNEDWIKCPALCQQFFCVFRITFFSLKVKICTMKVFRIFFRKNGFLLDGDTF